MTTIFKDGNEWVVRDARLGVDARFKSHGTAQEIANGCCGVKLMEMQGAAQKDIDDKMEAIRENIRLTGRVILQTKCECGLHWGHTGKHAPKGVMQG